MSENNWQKIKWILITIKELRKKSYPLIRYGIRLIILSLTLLPTGGFVINLLIPKEMLPKALQFLWFVFSFENIPIYTLIICIITFFIGCLLISVDLRKVSKLARSTSKILISGMLGTTLRFPNEILSKSELGKTRETVVLGISEQEKDYIDKQISFFNAERTINIYKRFVFNNDCTKVYLGGIARIPFLVAYGTCFRSASVKIVYYDKFHRDGNWKLLNNVDSNINFLPYNSQNINTNKDGQIGIAMGFTNRIYKHQLPSFIRENTLILEPDTEIERNLITNQDNLYAISMELQKIIDYFSNKNNCKEIHMFLSVQTTLAIEIGRKYQEGIHKDWVIHNFDNGKYQWGIKINSKNCERYTIL